MTQRVKLKNQRPRAFWGALVGSLVNLAGGIYSANKQASIAKQQAEQQERLARQQAELMNNNNLAATMNNYYNSLTDDNENYRLQYKNGGKLRRKLGNTLAITDGGFAIPIDNNTYLLRGGYHTDINETGQTGIGINYKGKEIEAENNEVLQKKGPEYRIFSDQPMFADGSSPAEQVLAGFNKDKVFKAQSRFNRRRLASRPVEDRPQAKWGMSTVGSDYLNLGGDILSAIGTWAFGNKALNATKDLLSKPIDIPQRTSIIAPRLDTRYHNEAQLAEVERNRERTRNLIQGNTASSPVGLNRMQTVDTDAMIEKNKLHDERINKEKELINKNAELEFERDKFEAEKVAEYDKMKFTADMDRLNKQYELSGQQADFTTNTISNIGKGLINFNRQRQQRYYDEQALSAGIAASGLEAPYLMHMRNGDYFTPEQQQRYANMYKTILDSNPENKAAKIGYSVFNGTNTTPPKFNLKNIKGMSIVPKYNGIERLNNIVYPRQTRPSYMNWG